MLKIASKTCQQQLYNYTLVFKRITGRKHCWKPFPCRVPVQMLILVQELAGNSGNLSKAEVVERCKLDLGICVSHSPTKLWFIVNAYTCIKKSPSTLVTKIAGGLTMLLQEKMKTQECLKNLSSLHIQGLSEHCSTVPNPTHMYLWIATVKTKWTPLERVYNIILFTIKLTIQ